MKGNYMENESMNVVIQPAPVDAKSLIEDMLQPYFAELEQFASIGTNEHGRYEYDYLDAYWSEPGARHPFLVKVDGNIAGFTLVNQYSRLGNPASHSIAEFYVCPEFRWSGVGTEVAAQTFGLFPGSWEVGVLEQNLPARRFWDRVIHGLASGDVQVHNDVWKGPVFSFWIASEVERT